MCGLKGKDAAELLGISASYLSEIEKGQKEPTLLLLHSYAKVFDIPVSSLLFFAENMDAPAEADPTVHPKVGAMLQLLKSKSAAQE